MWKLVDLQQEGIYVMQRVFIRKLNNEGKKHNTQLRWNWHFQHPIAHCKRKPGYCWFTACIEPVHRNLFSWSGHLMTKALSHNCPMVKALSGRGMFWISSWFTDTQQNTKKKKKKGSKYFPITPTRYDSRCCRKAPFPLSPFSFWIKIATAITSYPYTPSSSENYCWSWLACRCFLHQAHYGGY